MKSLNQFLSFRLTKKSMISIVGGGDCCVCSLSSSGNYSCGAKEFSQEGALAASIEVNDMCEGDGYSYVNACGSFCDNHQA